MIDTGLHTMTGGRIKRIQKYIGNEAFLLTYGDGVSDVDITATIRAHRESRKCLSMMAYQPGGHLGVLDIQNEEVKSFIENQSNQELD